MPKENNWIQFQEFATQHNNMLMMFADPKTDEIMILFRNKASFVKFPMENMTKGVIFNVLRKGRFNDTIDAFMAGILKGFDAKVEEPEVNQFAHVVGGSVKSLAIEPEVGKLEVIKKQKNGKKK